MRDTAFVFDSISGTHLGYVLQRRDEKSPNPREKVSLDIDIPVTFCPCRGEKTKLCSCRSVGTIFFKAKKGSLKKSALKVLDNFQDDLVVASAEIQKSRVLPKVNSVRYFQFFSTR